MKTQLQKLNELTWAGQNVIGNHAEKAALEGRDIFARSCRQRAQVRRLYTVAPEKKCVNMMNVETFARL